MVRVAGCQDAGCAVETPRLLSAGDLNADGNRDLVEAGCGFQSVHSITWCVQLGDGNGIFGNPITVMSNSLGGFTVAADFNRDQKSDIAIESAPPLSSSGGVFVLLNTTPPAPGVIISPTSVTFPSQVVGTCSSPISVTANTGKGVLTVEGVTFTGTNASEFGQSNCTSIQPGANCSIEVVLTPTVGGNAAASLAIVDNAVGSPQAVTVSGGATAPRVTISPSALTFPSHLVGTKLSSQRDRE
jgi:Abnormal spindle-like microcephaly-assoc'd, ASPM-SPD-2-Hydin